MYIQEPITEEKIQNIFEEARNDVEEYKNKFDIPCSTNIHFAGFNEELNPIKLWYNSLSDIFCMQFSKHYMLNTEKKIKKSFIRYFLCTNQDHTFKNRQELNSVFHKIKNAYFFDTLVNDYLYCDVSRKKTIYCDKCHRAFYIDKNSDIYLHIEEYQCMCGGELLRYSDIQSQKSELYTEELTNNRLDSIYDKDFFKNIIYDENDLQNFHDFIHLNKKISRNTLEPEIKRAIDNQQYHLLSMYNLAFPKEYTLTCHYIRRKYKDIVFKVCPPTMEYHPIRKTCQKPQTNIINNFLDRKQYPCDDDLFHKIEQYSYNNHTLKMMRNILKETIAKKNSMLLTSLYALDSKQFNNSLRYLLKSEQNFIKEWRKIYENHNESK